MAGVTSGVSAQSGRESGRLGRLAPGSVSPRAGRQAPGADRHGWLCGFGGGDSDGVSAGTTSALLGAYDAQHPGESAEVRPCGSEDRSAGHLSGGRAGQSRNRLSQLRRPLAAAVRRGGATAGTGLTGVAVVLRLSPAPVAQTAHHQRDRALLRGSATENPTYGVHCERRKCGPHHLLHLPEIQSGMENPHPQPIYTSCLTSPAPCIRLTMREVSCYIYRVPRVKSGLPVPGGFLKHVSACEDPENTQLSFGNKRLRKAKCVRRRPR